MDETEGKKRSAKNHFEPLAENAYHILRNSIMQGIYSPGTALLEEILSANLRMSRTPIRTALTRLEAEGLLVGGPDRTLRIPGLDAKSLEDTFYARITVESAIVELATSKATEEHILHLEHLMWSEEMANKNRDEALAGGIDRMFHIYLSEVADNFYFRDFTTRINARVSLILSQSNTLGDALIPALVEHKRIVDAIKNKEPEEARRAMEEHLTNVLSRIKSEI
jgi:DNA-binding GntR family transcriptional regulator